MPCRRFASPTRLDVQQATDTICQVTDALASGRYPPEAGDDPQYWVVETLGSALNALGVSWTLEDPG